MNGAYSTYSLLFSALTILYAHAYTRAPCTRSVRRDFQLDDCYITPLSTSIALTEASFVLSHNAATGYIRSQLSKTGLSSPYSKTQVGNFYQQLNDGARALDVRLKLLTNGTIIFHHGPISIPVTLEQGLIDILDWCRDNPDELVLLLPSHFAYEGDEYGTLSSNAASVYQNVGVNYYACNEVYQWTIQDALDASALPNGGYLLVLDGQDSYGSSCAKENWAEDRLITCWNNHTNCRKNGALFDDLLEYTMESANNSPTDSYGTLGPPYSLEKTPFNEIQALWQSTTESIVIGLAHFSSLIQDNRKSRVNEKMARAIYEGKFASISLFAVDNVAERGNAILSVLRTQCGQSDTLSKCGKALDPPRLTWWRPTIRHILIVVAAVYLVWFVYYLCYILKDGKIWRTLRARLEDGRGTHLLDSSGQYSS